MTEIIAKISAEYPIAALVVGCLTGAYTIFCAVAAFTPTKADDKIRDKIKSFFSLK